MRRFGLGFLVLLILLAVSSGCSPPDAKKKTALIEPSLDNKYDFSYRLLISKEFDLTSLNRWVRPVLPALLTEKGEVAAVGRQRTIGILWKEYVITSTGVFFQLPSVPAEIDPSLVHQGAMLLWDILPGGIQESEGLEIVFLDQASRVALFKRAQSSKFPAGPKEFPYKIGNTAELKELNSLVNIGYYYFRNRSITGLLLPMERARFTVPAIVSGKDIFGFHGSVSHYNWGGPIFALRDGEPEIVGVVTGSYLVQGEETRGFALTIEKLLSILKVKGGLQ